MRRLFILIALTVLLSVATFAQSTVGSVSGTVSFGGDKAVLHNAAVQVVELKKTVVTDDEGKYQFTNIPAGKYTLRAHLEGFGDETQSVTVTAGAPATADFVLNIAGVKE